LLFALQLCRKDMCCYYVKVNKEQYILNHCFAHPLKSVLVMEIPAKDMSAEVERHRIVIDLSTYLCLSMMGSGVYGIGLHSKGDRLENLAVAETAGCLP
jgi:hypothetical protein